MRLRMSDSGGGCSIAKRVVSWAKTIYTILIASAIDVQACESRHAWQGILSQILSDQRLGRGKQFSPLPLPLFPYMGLLTDTFFVPPMFKLKLLTSCRRIEQTCSMTWNCESISLQLTWASLHNRWAGYFKVPKLLCKGTPSVWQCLLSLGHWLLWKLYAQLSAYYGLSAKRGRTSWKPAVKEKDGTWLPPSFLLLIWNRQPIYARRKQMTRGNQKWPAFARLTA